MAQTFARNGRTLLWPSKFTLLPNVTTVELTQTLIGRKAFPSGIDNVDVDAGKDRGFKSRKKPYMHVVETRIIVFAPNS